MSTEAIRTGTGRGWEEWLAFLEGIGARDLSHKDIAKRVKQEGITSGWWAQYVTVAYEQHIGRRVAGQDHQGDYQVSVTKTLPGSMDDAMEAWNRLTAGLSSFDGVAIVKGPRVGVTAKWRRWGVTLGDGSRMTASANQKNPDKSLLAIGHEKLGSLDEVERWRAFWKDFLAKL